MLTIPEFLKSVKQEIHIIKHLAAKLKTEQLDYRPTPKQRSMLELLQYLTFCAIGPARNIFSGNWDHIEAMSREANAVRLDTFAAAMDLQFEKIQTLLKNQTESELAAGDAEMPWGEPIKKGAALVNMPLKCLTAYRMQLFLYAKSAGLTDIGPANCWVGVDIKEPVD